MTDDRVRRREEQDMYNNSEREKSAFWFGAFCGSGVIVVAGNLLILISRLV